MPSYSHPWPLFLSLLLSLLLLSTPSWGQSRSSSTVPPIFAPSTAGPSVSSSSTGLPASPQPVPYPYLAFPVIILQSEHGTYGPQQLAFDPTGRLFARYDYGAPNFGLLYNVSDSNQLTVVGSYPYSSSTFSQVVLYQNQSVTVVVGPQPSNRNLLRYEAQATSLTWLSGGPSSTYAASYAGCTSGSYNSAYITVAVDQQLGVFYAAAATPCNAVYQFAINGAYIASNGSFYGTTLTQTLAFTSSSPSMYQPIGLAVDSSSMLYVCDSNNRVFQFNSEGVQTQVMILGGLATSFVSFPSFTLDPVTGEFLVLDTTANLVRRWSRDGTRQGALQLTNGTINSMAVNAKGDLFLLDFKQLLIVVVPANQAAQFNAAMSARSFSMTLLAALTVVATLVTVL